MRMWKICPAGTGLMVMAAAAMIAGCAGTAKPVRFAVAADVQYADKDTAMGRYYRAGIDGLSRFVEAANLERPDFAIQVGDIIDGGEHAAAEMDRVLVVYDRLGCEHYHVVGNHDFNGLAREAVLSKMKLNSAYYGFAVRGVRFIVLDMLDLGVQGGWAKDSEAYRVSEAMLRELTTRGEANALPYNGGLGQAQLAWLDKELSAAHQEKQDVVVFGHLPLLPETDTHIAWNAAAIRDVLERYGCVRVYIGGHNHAGGYACHNGIHYMTLPSMVDDPAAKTWAMMSLYPDRLEIKGSGRIENQVLVLYPTGLIIPRRP
ncbi:MAG: metallophosphoesterase [Sedimentisphaerales bacterium]|nr:metallophosphoesterase [Sedimentisphaerales bacterium]